MSGRPRRRASAPRTAIALRRGASEQPGARARGSRVAEPVDPAKLRDAVATLLRAAGADLSAKDFTGTPDRVAKLWCEAFLVGATLDPARILGEPVLGEAPTEMVVIRELPFSGMCPHHLLPYIGRATVAYLPSDKLVGFGRLGELVRCCTGRLTLQERACNDVVDAIMQHLDARGAACIMVGEHACLRIPEQRHAAEVVTASFRGEFRDRAELRDRLMPRA
ncbi:MAG TPA: GTP cyclohydrolase I [Nannocystaceae bacterium]|nr:GTP cyclohydrolase I [Nannocystaceae bacterium]